MSTRSAPIHTGSSADLAFAVLVLGAYFTTFSSIKDISTLSLIALMGLGILYLSIGVYGYAYCARSKSIPLHVGYFGVQIWIGWLIIYLSGQTGYNAILLLPLAGHSVVLLVESWRYVVNGALVISYVIVVHLLSGGWDVVWTNMPVFMAGQITILVFTQMTVGEEKARREVQGLAAKLESANRQLQEYALKVENYATVNERNRLAREIHDGLGHHLTALNMQIRAANAVLPQNQERVKEFLVNAENITHQALLDVRQSVSALRERTEEDRPLVGQVESIAAMWRSTGAQIQVEVAGLERPLRPEIFMAIIRTIQEAISNSVKYAQATRLIILLDYSSLDKFQLRILDNGIGAETVEGGFGLVGMQERITLLQGSLIIKTAKGEGFMIDIKIPTGRI
jgi:signal transduction histidine kinase